MGYDAAAVRKLGVDPYSWKWFNANYDKYRVMDPNGTTWVERESVGVKAGLFALFVLVIVGYFAAFVAIAASTGGNLIPGLIGPAILLLAGIFVQVRSTGSKVLGFIVLGISAVVALLHGVYAEAVELAMTNFGVQLLTVLCIGRFLRLSTYPKTTAVEVPVHVDGTSLWSNPNYRVFGEPGRVASAVAKFGQEAVEAGVRGEENTAVLLDLLLKIPGTTVYHGLRFPGSQNADVDHAVAHGNMVYLIDSKMFRWGEYEWQCMEDGSDKIVRTDGYGHGYKNHMDAAAEKYRCIFGPGVSVVPLILMHGKNVAVGENRTSCKGVMMLTANDAMRCMGDTLSEQMRQWRDNPSVRGKLINNLKL